MMLLTQVPPVNPPPPPPGLEIDNGILILGITAILYAVFIILNIKKLKYK